MGHALEYTCGSCGGRFGIGDHSATKCAAQRVKEKADKLRAFADRVDVLAERSRRSFRYFVEKAWPHVPRLKNVPFVGNWHIDAICDHLQAVARGDIRFLLINVPPRSTKTELLGIFFTPWVWTWKPSFQGIFAGLVNERVKNDSLRCRELVEQVPWYQDVFVRGGWTLRDDQNRQGDFSNTLGGRRLSTAVGGHNLIGEGGDLLAGDDLQDDKTVESATERQNARDFWDGTLSSRANNPKTVAKVLMQQRLHAKDISDHVLSSKMFVHLCLPTEYNPRRKCVTYVKGVKFFEDPRTEEGELLNPARFGADEVALARTPGVGMGPKKYKAQHDQDPGSDQGEKFRKEYWRFWKPDGVGSEFKCQRPVGCVLSQDVPAVALPKKLHKIMSVDCAFGDSRKNDWVVSTIFGFAGANIYVLDRFRAHVSIVGTKDAIRQQHKLYPDLREKLVELAANGQGVVDELRGEVPGIIGVKVAGQGSKESRAEVALPRVHAGQVYLPDGAPWLEEWVEEFGSFPNGSHDDQVDTLSQAVIFMNSNRSDLQFARDMAKL